MQDVIFIGSFLGAITGIVAFAVKIYKVIKNVEDKFDTMQETLRMDTMYICKIAILSEELPLVDRIHAGERYIAMGGNGIIKKKYEKLLKEYEEKGV